MTLLPFRIEGTPGGGPLSISGLIVEYESPDGAVWELTAPGSDRHRNMFLLPGGLSGLRGRVEWDETESVNQYGVRRSGPKNFRTPPFDVGLTLGLRTEPGEMESLSRRWEDAWSHELPGKLHLRSGGHGRYWCWVDTPVFPDWPDNLSRRRYLETSMTCRVRQGHIYGATKRFTGTATVRVGGDRPLAPSCKLLWSAAGTVKFPSGITVTLPAPGFGGPKWINLDRGMMGQVTFSDGRVDSAGWSALQGNIMGVDLIPDTNSAWVMTGGVELHVTPRYINPWR